MFARFELEQKPSAYAIDAFEDELPDEGGGDVT
jgi:hypothetical protein